MEINLDMSNLIFLVFPDLPFYSEEDSLKGLQIKQSQWGVNGDGSPIAHRTVPIDSYFW